MVARRLRTEPNLDEQLPTVRWVKPWLEARGWQWQAAWDYRHDQYDDMQLGDIVDGKRKHVVRDMWRQHCYNKFVNSDRHELKTIGDDAFVSDIDFDSIRKGIEITKQLQHVLLAASVSPAWLKVAMSRELEGDELELIGECVWPGCRQLGHFMHCAWECPCRPADALRKPDSMLLARLGWPRKTDDRKLVARVWKWLSVVQDQFWSKRFKPPPAPPHGSY